MTIVYTVTPIITWVLVGPLKFLINSLRERRLAFDLVGNGGFPSNHSAVVSSMATLIALREGISNPAFGVAVTIGLIVIIDANSLRQHVGKHARAINQISANRKEKEKLRERMGHTKLEICGGLITGMLIGWVVSILLP